MNKKMLTYLLIIIIVLLITSTTNIAVESKEINKQTFQFKDNLQQFLDNSYTKLYCVLPSNAIVGQSIKFTLQAWDWAERICKKPFKSSISFDSTDKGAILPEDFSFRFRDLGIKTFENKITFSTPGIQYITVSDSVNGIYAISNPVKVTEEEPEYKWYWGDIHCHSVNSDGMGTLNRDYKYARDVSMLDFCSFSDHDYCWFLKTQTLYMKTIGWKLAKKAVNKFYDSGKFVTLLSYEYTKLEYDGHYIVYYNTVEDAPFFSCIDEKSDRVVELWSLLKDWKEKTGNDVITIPHHLIDLSKTWRSDSYDPEFVTLVEIFQFRGSSEMLNELGNPVPFRYDEINEGGHSAQDALAKGFKVGFMASSDDHTGHPGHVPYTFAFLTEPRSYLGPLRRMPRDSFGNILRWPLGLSLKLYFFTTLITDEDCFPEELYPNGGIVGVYAKELTREEIFNSLKDRKCIAATNCNRMIVDFTVNDYSIGNGSEVYVADANTSRIINCSIAGTAPITNITLVKNNQTFYIKNGKGTDPHDISNYRLNFSIVDNEPITGIAWDENNNTDGRDFYYIRVLQANGWAGWVGPIWVNPSGDNDLKP